MKSKARIVRVGNSRGIRIPKAMLARAGWAEAAAQLAARGNSLLDPAAPTEFDDTEWVWE